MVVFLSAAESLMTDHLNYTTFTDEYIERV